MGCCTNSVSQNRRKAQPTVRGCTDIFWLFLFLTMWIIMFFVAAFAFVYGNPKRLVHGYDSFGNTCGARNDQLGYLNYSGLDMSAKPYVFYLDVTNIKHSLQICVKSCPNMQINTLDELRSFTSESETNLCRYDYDVLDRNNEDVKHGLNEMLTLSSSLGPCPKLPIFRSVSVLNRCIPTDFTSSIRIYLKNWDEVEQFLSDIYSAWPFILGFNLLTLVKDMRPISCFLLILWVKIAFYFSYIGASIFHLWIIPKVQGIKSDIHLKNMFQQLFTPVQCLLSFIQDFSSLGIVSLFYMCPRFIGAIILILVSLVAVGGTIVLWWVYYEIRENILSPLPFIEESLTNENAFLIYAICASIFTLIILLLVLKLKSRVSFIGTLFKESVECLSVLPALYIQPILSFIMLMIYYAFWIIVIMYLASARYPGTEDIRPFSNVPISATAPIDQMLTEELNFHSTHYIRNMTAPSVKTFTRVEFLEGTWIRYMWWLYIIGLVWVSEFISACQQIVIAGAVATWYFNGQKVISNFPVQESVSQLFYYHLGTAALGSIVITIFKIPRILLSFIYSRLIGKQSDKCFTQCQLKTCICCFFCYEKCIRYINHNAYTVVALRGVNFFDAGNRALEVLAGNPLHLATYNRIGDIVLFFGKVIITAFIGAASLIVFKTQTSLERFAAPVLIICIFAFFISHCVVSVYEVVIDTLYLCICEDEDINGESGLWKTSALANLEDTKKNKMCSSVPSINMNFSV